jgi:hypothetical protein
MSGLGRNAFGNQNILVQTTATTKTDPFYKYIMFRRSPATLFALPYIVLLSNLSLLTWPSTSEVVDKEARPVHLHDVWFEVILGFIGAVLDHLGQENWRSKQRSATIHTADEP